MTRAHTKQPSFFYPFISLIPEITQYIQQQKSEKIIKVSPLLFCRLENQTDSVIDYVGLRDEKRVGVQTLWPRSTGEALT